MRNVGRVVVAAAVLSLSALALAGGKAAFANGKRGDAPVRWKPREEKKDYPMKGFTYVKLYDEKAPYRAQMVKIDLKTPGIRFHAVNGSGKTCSVLAPDAMAAQLKKSGGGKVRPIVGTNADFFDNGGSSKYRGNTLRMAVSDGRLISTGYGQEGGCCNYVWETDKGEVGVSPLKFSGSLAVDGQTLTIKNVNTFPGGHGWGSGVSVYTDDWNADVPEDGVRISIPVKGKAKPGAAAVDVADLEVNVMSGAYKGKKAKLTWTVSGATGPVRNAVGVWLDLVKDGKVMPNLPSYDAYPCTAFGFNPETKTYVVFVCDGRQPDWSKSVDCDKLAALLAAEGCTYAGEFDGGGSTAMWMDRLGIVNRPSDGGARPVGSGIFFSVSK